jgi:hypothetical protein
LWGWTGHALLAIGKPIEAARWYADWRHRPDAEPWMLLNLALALRCLDFDIDAEEVSRHAVTLPEDATSIFHEVWIAFDDALAGCLDDARARTKVLEGKELPPACRFLFKLSEILIDLQEPSGKPCNTPKALLRRWQRAPVFCPRYWEDPPLKRACRECGRKVAKACRMSPGVLWYIGATIDWATWSNIKRWFALKLRGG